MKSTKTYCKTTKTSISTFDIVQPRGNTGFLAVSVRIKKMSFRSGLLHVLGQLRVERGRILASLRLALGVRSFLQTCQCIVSCFIKSCTFAWECRIFKMKQASRRCDMVSAGLVRRRYDMGSGWVGCTHQQVMNTRLTDKPKPTPSTLNPKP